MISLEDVRNYINEKITPYAFINIDVLYEAPEAIMLRNDPSGSDEVTYMNRSSMGEMIFSLYCKSKNGRTAINQVNEIIRVLNLPEYVDLTDSKKDFVKCSIYNNMNFVQETEQHEFIYTASFLIEYERTR